jgi:hypothetical protein
MTLSIQETQNYDTQHTGLMYDTQHYDIQHKGLIYDTQHSRDSEL